MRKPFTKLLLLVAPFVYSQNVLGQVVDHSSESTLEILTTSDIAKTSGRPNVDKKYKAIALAESMKLPNVSEAFGSYMLPNTNYLVIAPTDGKVYDNARLVDQKSGEIVFSVEVSKEKNAVDMKDVSKGIYLLVLTNDQGGKYVEDIVMM